MFPVEIEQTGKAEEDGPAGEDCDPQSAQQSCIAGFKLSP
jgi:hypothetical protein